MKVVAIVGMAGSGKSEIARILQENGFAVVRFGDVTDDELDKQGRELNEANERSVRESLREEHGMAAYAILNLPRIDAALKESNVVADGLYSWEEYLHLKQYYGDDLIIIAVYSPPTMRYARLGSRRVRLLTVTEATSRDHAEIENMNKGGPIAMADYTIINTSTLADFKRQALEIISRLK
jgi:dephospho-CoA kinase